MYMHAQGAPGDTDCDTMLCTVYYAIGYFRALLLNM